MNQVHDHFDGSSHCQECRGPCRLDAAALTLTRLIRAWFEGQAFEFRNGRQRDRFHCNLIVEGILKEAGVDIAGFWARAKGAL